MKLYIVACVMYQLADTLHLFTAPDGVFIYVGKKASPDTCFIKHSDDQLNAIAARKYAVI